MTTPINAPTDATVMAPIDATPMAIPDFLNFRAVNIFRRSHARFRHSPWIGSRSVKRLNASIRTRRGDRRD
jgi:hypothetical protein